VTHEEAWTRLPDLLRDRDDTALLAHVRSCPDCQRQLFLLGRVDRLLRTKLDPRRPRMARAPRGRLLAAGAVVIAATAAAAATLAAVVVHHGGAHEMMFRPASGRAVGHATMGHSDARNDSFALVAEHLPVARGRAFTLWAGDTARSPMLVGHFMVDRGGACTVRFNLPATHTWGRFWITRPNTPAAIVAST
jgi:hypothetical protein